MISLYTRTVNFHIAIDNDNNDIDIDGANKSRWLYMSTIVYRGREAGE